LSQLHCLGQCCQCSLHSCKDFVGLLLGVDVSIAALPAVKKSSSNHLDLEEPRGVLGGFSRDLELAGEPGLKFLLDLAELGLVASSTTVVHVDPQQLLEPGLLAYVDRAGPLQEVLLDPWQGLHPHHPLF